MEVRALDLEKIRSEFPAIHQEVAGSPLVYLDNAATTQRPQAVLRALMGFYGSDNANVHRGVHALSQRATDSFEAARRTIARAINAESDEQVVFTKGCTEALNLVASSWGRSALKKGDTVLVSTMEHHSNIVPWQIVAEQTGAKIEPIPIDDRVQIDMEWLQNRLDSDVKAVCVKAVCNASGTVNPVKQITEMAHMVGAITVIDAAQALAHRKVDVQDLDADFVSTTAHKVYGPMGIGALYGKRHLLEDIPPYQAGGGMIRSVSFEGSTYADLPDKFEPGTPNVAGAIGYGAALSFLEGIGVEVVAEHEDRLTKLAENRLDEIDGVILHGRAEHKAGIVSFTMDCAHPHDIGTVLDQYGVAVRTGHHCCQPLMNRLGVPATTRASFAMYNTESDVDALIGAVLKVKEMFA